MKIANTIIKPLLVFIVWVAVITQVIAIWHSLSFIYHTYDTVALVMGVLLLPFTFIGCPIWELIAIHSWTGVLLTYIPLSIYAISSTAAICIDNN